MAVTAPSVPSNAGRAETSTTLRADGLRTDLRGIFHPGLPFYIVPMLPVFWALGLGYFTFAIAGAASGLGLLLMKPIRIPRGFGPWLLYIGWMLTSVFMLNPSVNRYLSFTIRAITYIWGCSSVRFVSTRRSRKFYLVHC